MSIHFAQIGLDEAVLQELKQQWEHKVFTSRVAEFPQAQGSLSGEGYGYTEDRDEYGESV